MRNHTLIQTIARANRVSEGKEAGLIVDYVGIFRNLKKALAIYARPETGGDTPTFKIQNRHQGGLNLAGISSLKKMTLCPFVLT